jgi:hypothetical protein
VAHGAHQWWGDSSPKDWEDDAWLSEGDAFVDHETQPDYSFGRRKAHAECGGGSRQSGGDSKRQGAGCIINRRWLDAAHVASRDRRGKVLEGIREYYRRYRDAMPRAICAK